MNFKKLNLKAKKLRQDTFLTFIKTGEAHLGGSFSMIEALLTLYEIIMKKNDKFILSSIKSFKKSLDNLSKLIETKNTNDLVDFFSAVKKARDKSI